MLAVVGILRLLVVTLGLVGVVVGAIIAWRAESAATLLVVSAALIALGLVLGRDWRETGAHYGALRVLVRRYGDEVAEAVETSRSDGEVRARLKSLEEQAAAVLGEMERASARPRFRPGWTTPPPHTYTPGHSVGDSSVRLTLGMTSTSPLYRITCTVVDPHGSPATTTVPTGGASLLTYSAAVTYPDDFRAAEPLQPGTYHVEWKSGPIFAGLFTAPEVVARDAFAVASVGPAPVA